MSQNSFAFKSFLCYFFKFYFSIGFIRHSFVKDAKERKLTSDMEMEQLKEHANVPMVHM